ncbi:hypothetical protein pb186bvf_019728 [Paramecium bursaria]
MKQSFQQLKTLRGGGLVQCSQTQTIDFDYQIRSENNVQKVSEIIHFAQQKFQNLQEYQQDQNLSQRLQEEIKCINLIVIYIRQELFTKETIKEMLDNVLILLGQLNKQVSQVQLEILKICNYISISQLILNYSIQYTDFVKFIDQQMIQKLIHDSRNLLCDNKSYDSHLYEIDIFEFCINQCFALNNQRNRKIVNHIMTSIDQLSSLAFIEDNLDFIDQVEANRYRLFFVEQIKFQIIVKLQSGLALESLYKQLYEIYDHLIKESNNFQIKLSWIKILNELLTYNPFIINTDINQISHIWTELLDQEVIKKLDGLENVGILQLQSNYEQNYEFPFNICKNYENLHELCVQNLERLQKSIQDSSYINFDYYSFKKLLCSTKYTQDLVIQLSEYMNIWDKLNCILDSSFFNTQSKNLIQLEQQITITLRNICISSYFTKTQVFGFNEEFYISNEISGSFQVSLKKITDDYLNQKITEDQFFGFIEEIQSQMNISDNIRVIQQCLPDIVNDLGKEIKSFMRNVDYIIFQTQQTYRLKNCVVQQIANLKIKPLQVCYEISKRILEIQIVINKHFDNEFKINNFQIVQEFRQYEALIIYLQQINQELIQLAYHQPQIEISSIPKRQQIKLQNLIITKLKELVQIHQNRYDNFWNWINKEPLRLIEEMQVSNDQQKIIQPIKDILKQVHKSLIAYNNIQFVSEYNNFYKDNIEQLLQKRYIFSQNEILKPTLKDSICLQLFQKFQTVINNIETQNLTQISEQIQQNIQLVIKNKNLFSKRYHNTIYQLQQQQQTLTVQAYCESVLKTKQIFYQTCGQTIQLIKSSSIRQMLENILKQGKFKENDSNLVQLLEDKNLIPFCKLLQLNEWWNTKNQLFSVTMRNSRTIIEELAAKFAQRYQKQLNFQILISDYQKLKKSIKELKQLIRYFFNFQIDQMFISCSSVRSQINIVLSEINNLICLFQNIEWESLFEKQLMEQQIQIKQKKISKNLQKNPSTICVNIRAADENRNELINKEICNVVEDNIKCLQINGETGSGKSFTLKKIEEYLWMNYKPNSDCNYFPILIDLFKVIPRFIHLNESQESFEEIIFSNSEIGLFLLYHLKFIKTNRLMFIFIIDSYDLLSEQNANSFLKKLFRWCKDVYDVKFITTSTQQQLPNPIYNDWFLNQLILFYPENRFISKILTLLPFNQEQLNDYAFQAGCLELKKFQRLETTKQKQYLSETTYQLVQKFMQNMSNRKDKLNKQYYQSEQQDLLQKIVDSMRQFNIFPDDKKFMNNIQVKSQQVDFKKCLKYMRIDYDTVSSPFILKIYFESLPIVFSKITQNYIKQQFITTYLREHKEKSIKSSHNSLIQFKEEDEVVKQDDYFVQQEDYSIKQSRQIWDFLIRKNFFNDFNLDELKMDIKNEQIDIYDPKIVYKALTAKRPSELDLFNVYLDQKCQDQLNKYSNQDQLKLEIDRLGNNLAIEMKNRNITVAEFKIIENIDGYREIRKILDQDIIMECLPIRQDRNYIQFEHPQLQTCVIAKDSIQTISNISAIYEQNNVFPINRKNFNDQILEFIDKKNQEDLYNCNMNKINLKEPKWNEVQKLITQALNNDCNLAETCFSMTHFSKKWKNLQGLSLNSSYAMAKIENKIDYNLVDYAENILDIQYDSHVEQIQFSQDGKSFYFMYGNKIWIGELDSGQCKQFMSDSFMNSKFYLSYDNKFILITQFTKHSIIYYDLEEKQYLQAEIKIPFKQQYDLILSQDSYLFCLKTDDLLLQLCRIKYDKIHQSYHMAFLKVMNIDNAGFNDQCLYFHVVHDNQVSMILENDQYKVHHVGPRHQQDKIYFIVKKVQINSIDDLILISSDYIDIYIYSLKFNELIDKHNLQQLGFINLEQNQIQYWHFLCQLKEEKNIYLITEVKEKLQVICIPVKINAFIQHAFSGNNTFKSVEQMEDKINWFHNWNICQNQNRSPKIIGIYGGKFQNINASPLNKIIIIIGKNDEIQIQDYNNNQWKIIKKITQFRF